MKKTKKIITAITFLAIGFANANAQSKQEIQAPKMPVDENTKLITYTGVIEVTGANKAELFRRGLAWFNAFYKNPTEVIREKDTVGLKIVGKPRFKILNEAGPSGVKTDAGLVQYTITLAMKDGKFKYEITAINWKQQSYFAIEKWVEQKDKYKANNYYLYQTDSIITQNVIKNLESTMKTAPKKIDKDNW